MTKQKLEFIETSRFFEINGRVGLFIGKDDDDGSITTTFPISSVFMRKRIVGFRIDEQQRPPKLYLDYLFRGRTKTSLNIGTITDVEEARQYVEKLNIPYNKSLKMKKSSDGE